MINRFGFIFSLLLLINGGLQAQGLVLEDINRDGAVTLLAFGDSITAGVGDESGLEGYPARVSTLIGVPVSASAIPGEELVEDGVRRFPSALVGANVDAVLIFEGENDAIRQVSSSDVSRTYQRMVNVARVLGVTPVLSTLTPPCCEHAGPALFTSAYSAIAHQLAIDNQIQIVDLERAWRSTCVNKEECELFNLPEGLHPNSSGYTVIAQTIAASLFGIDIFSPAGAAELEGALGLEQGSVLVKPDTAE